MSTSQTYDPYLPALHLPNQPNGVLVLDGSGVALGTFPQRVGTAAEIAALTLKSGELGFTTDTQETFIGDGATVGGLFRYQVPQIQTVTLSGGLPLPNLDTVTTANSIVFPKVLGATYRITFDVEFGGDSGNLSNFSLRLFCNGYLSPLYTASSPAIISTDWFDATSGALLERVLQKITLSESASDFGTACVMKQAGNLTRSGAGLRGSTTIKPLQELNTPRKKIVLHPVYRVGGTSTATAVVNATCQRIA